MNCLYVSAFLLLMGLSLIPGEPVWPCDEDFKELEKELDGDILLPGDEDFDDTKDPWVNLWPGDYVAVARPESEDDLVTLVDYARDNDLPLSLYSTGYDYKGRSTGYGRKTFHISMKKMKDKEIEMDDPENNNEATLTAQTGNTFKDLYEFVNESRKFAVGPNCLHSGPGGWHLGGGSSKFTSHFGLGVDQVIMIRVVTGNGEILEVRESGTKKITKTGNTETTEDVESDLWWALRGGGGGIGVIVSSYKLKLYDDPGIVVYNTQYPLRTNTADDLFGEEVLNEISAFLMDLPYKWGGIYFMDNLVQEPTPEQALNWPEGTIFNGTITFNMVFYGTWEESIEGYEKLKDIKPDWALYQTPINYTDHYEYILVEGFQIQTYQHYLGGTLLQDEDFMVADGETYTNFAAITDNMYDHSIPTWCALTIIGGHAKTYDQTEYSVSENYRNSRASLFCWLEWQNPDNDRDLDDENMIIAQNWFNYTLYPIGQGKYINKAEQTLLLDWKTEFWGPIENYERLLAVKTEVDPENLLGCIQGVGYGDIPWHVPEEQDCKKSAANHLNMNFGFIMFITFIYVRIMY